MAWYLVDWESGDRVELKLTPEAATELAYQINGINSHPGRHALRLRSIEAAVSLAITATIDPDMHAPSPAQIRYATTIAITLGLGIPDDVFIKRDAMQRFLDKNIPVYKARLLANRRR